MRAIGRQLLLGTLISVLGAASAFATTTTPSITVTRTATCTPGSNPPAGCAYEGPTFTETRTPTAKPGAPSPTPTCTPHSAPNWAVGFALRGCQVSRQRLVQRSLDLRFGSSQVDHQ